MNAPHYTPDMINLIVVLTCDIESPDELAPIARRGELALIVDDDPDDPDTGRCVELLDGRKSFNVATEEAIALVNAPIEQRVVALHHITEAQRRASHTSRYGSTRPQRLAAVERLRNLQWQRQLYDAAVATPVTPTR
jgi:hypothetical protein